MTSRNLLIQPVRTHSSQRSVNFLPALRYNIQDLRYVFLTNFSVLGTEETIRFPTNAELRDFYSLVFSIHWFTRYPFLSFHHTLMSHVYYNYILSTSVKSLRRWLNLRIKKCIIICNNQIWMSDYRNVKRSVNLSGAISFHYYPSALSVPLKLLLITTFLWITKDLISFFHLSSLSLFFS